MLLYEKEVEALDCAVNQYIANHPDEELTPEIVRDIIDGVDLEFNKKLENICKYISQLEFDIEYGDIEVKRIKDFQSKCSNKIGSLKGYLLPYILEKGKQKAGNFIISSRRSSRVEVLDEELIDEEFKKVETQVRIDKSLIKKRLAQLGSDSMKGVMMVHKDNLQIK